MKAALKNFIKWFLFILCLFLVQTCTKVYFKAKRMEKERMDNVNNTPYKYSDDALAVKERIESNSDKVLEKMKKTTNIDKKLKLLTDDLNKNLPQKIDNMIFSKVEQYKNREIRYCYIMPNENQIPSESQWNKYREAFLKQIKYSDDFKMFRKYKVTMSYAYYNTKGCLLKLIKISPKDYL